MLLWRLLRCIILLPWEVLSDTSEYLLNAEGWNPAVLSPGISDVSQDYSTSEISLPWMCGACRSCVCRCLWAIGKKLVINVTCKSIWSGCHVPAAYIIDVSREPWIWCCTVVMHPHIRPGSFRMLLLSLCPQVTDDPRCAVQKGEEVHSTSYGVFFPFCQM